MPTWRVCVWTPSFHQVTPMPLQITLCGMYRYHLKLTTHHPYQFIPKLPLRWKYPYTVCSLQYCVWQGWNQSDKSETPTPLRYSASSFGWGAALAVPLHYPEKHRTNESVFIDECSNCINHLICWADPQAWTWWSVIMVWWESWLTIYSSLVL